MAERAPSIYEVEILMEWVSKGGEITSIDAKRKYVDVMIANDWKKSCQLYDRMYDRLSNMVRYDTGWNDRTWNVRDKKRRYDEIPEYADRVKKYMYDEKMMGCDAVYRILHKYGRHKYVNCGDEYPGRRSYNWVHDPDKSYDKLKQENKLDYDFYKNRVEWFVSLIEEIVKEENAKVELDKRWECEVSHDGKYYDRYYRAMKLRFRLRNEGHRIMIPFSMVIRKKSVNLFDAFDDEICYFYDDKDFKSNIRRTFLEKGLNKFDFRY